jgi:hypothetical protein
MIYLGVAIGLAVVAAVVALLGLRLLLGRHWLLGWLRGMFGLIFLALAAVLALTAWDLRGYRPMLAEQQLGTLAFNKIEDQHYAVTLVDPAGNEQRFELNGDMWQLDARVLKWTDSLAQLGFKPGYRLDRLSGRYVSLEDEQNRPRSVVALRTDKPILDVWFWLHNVNRYFSLIDATYGSATYLPMSDGALFSVSVGASGLVARPLNDRAKLAVDRWN